MFAVKPVAEMVQGSGSGFVTVQPVAAMVQGSGSGFLAVQPVAAMFCCSEAGCKWFRGFVVTAMVQVLCAVGVVFF